MRSDDNDGQRWTGLRSTADGDVGGRGRGGGGGGGEGLIAREIREQRERERQLLVQRHRLTRPEDTAVTSPYRDYVGEKRSSLGDSETEMPRDSDVIVDGQRCRSRLSRKSTERDESQEVFRGCLFQTFLVKVLYFHFLTRHV